MFPLRQDPNGYKTIDGRRLAKRLKGTTADTRALLAHGMTTEGARLTQAQAAALARVSQAYVSAASRASPEQREAIKHGGLSLSTLHNKRQEPTDAKLDRLVAKYGADRVMAALDRATMPQRRAAE